MRIKEGHHSEAQPKQTTTHFKIFFRVSVSIVCVCVFFVCSVAAISLAINVPSGASLPHSLLRGFQKLLGIGLVVNYIFKEAEPYKVNCFFSLCSSPLFFFFWDVMIFVILPTLPEDFVQSCDR
jgi:hypothetical protein